jgi:murein DD-endopeptidase MepM/ murein hydrolase activator NlpD
VDIFAKEGTRVVASTTGIVLFTGEVRRGGNVVVVLGSKWRVHYYAHLQKINTSWFSFYRREKLSAT